MVQTGHVSDSSPSLVGRVLRASLMCALTPLGCSSEPPAALDDETSDDEGREPGDESEPGDDPEPEEDPSPSVTGSCDYVSPFTSAPECREYLGQAWTDADVRSACDMLSGEAALGQACGDEDVLGRCVLDGDTDRELHIVAYGTDPDTCADQKLGCEVFGGGAWEPADICDDGSPGGGSGGPPPFEQPILVCRDPLPGEPAGSSEGGQVCTWQAISGCTEEGRQFAEYASCDAVYTQRPYYPVPPAPDAERDDPRLEDAAYVAELDWVRSQVEASACICCHSDIAPNGPSNWYVEQPGNWINGFFDTGLAFGSGWIDSSAFGAYPPEENNGFDRTQVGIPSTDPARMLAFFVAELEYRGLSEADFADEVPAGGPLHTQRIYEPEACENGEGVDADGTIRWTGGPARYVYVLDAGSDNPTVPPNLDLPDGTRWRIDVPTDGTPVESGEVRYGQPPEGTNQRFPEQGAPPALESGQTYYLYVTKDVIQPVTRCLFTY